MINYTEITHLGITYARFTLENGFTYDVPLTDIPAEQIQEHLAEWEKAFLILDEETLSFDESDPEP